MASRGIRRIDSYTPFRPVTPVEALAPGKAGKTGKAEKAGKSRNAGEQSAVNAVLASQARRIPAMDMARPRNENRREIVTSAVASDVAPKLLNAYGPQTLGKVTTLAFDRVEALLKP